MRERKIIIADGLLWEGNTKNVENILGTYEADKIAQKNSFVYVEQLIRNFDNNKTLLLDENLKIVKVT